MDSLLFTLSSFPLSISSRCLLLEHILFSTHLLLPPSLSFSAFLISQFFHPLLSSILSLCCTAIYPLFYPAPLKSLLCSEKSRWGFHSPSKSHTNRISDLAIVLAGCSRLLNLSPIPPRTFEFRKRKSRAWLSCSMGHPQSEYSSADSPNQIKPARLLVSSKESERKARQRPAVGMAEGKAGHEAMQESCTKSRKQ